MYNDHLFWMKLPVQRLAASLASPVCFLTDSKTSGSHSRYFSISFNNEVFSCFFSSKSLSNWDRSSFEIQQDILRFEKNIKVVFFKDIVYPSLQVSNWISISITNYIAKRKLTEFSFPILAFFTLSANILLFSSKSLILFVKSSSFRFLWNLNI